MSYYGSSLTPWVNALLTLARNMIILFKSDKLKQILNDGKELKRHYGQSASIIRSRLDDLHAAFNLSEIATLPQHRCHELKGDRKGQLSIDLKHPFRLVFEPTDTPPARKTDGGMDWHGIRVIKILEIVNYHDR